MSVLFKVLNFIVIIQKVISETYNQQYTTPGTYAVLIPTNTSGVTMSMWGAGGAGTGTTGGAGARIDAGGSGAFVSCTINALPGSTIYLLVGGGGAVSNYGQGTSSAIGGGGNNILLDRDISFFILRMICSMHLLITINYKAWVNHSTLNGVLLVEVVEVPFNSLLVWILS